VDVLSTGAEWQVQLSKALGTVVGIAANHQRRPGLEALTAPSWLGGLSFDATDALRVHASASRKVRVPSIDQLFNVSTGNPSLRAEHAYTIDAGADYRMDDETTFGVTAFWTDARDFIERISGSVFENQDHYRFRGAELSISTTAIPRLDLRGAYSFLDSDDITDPELTRRLQTRPRHRTSLTWIWTPIDKSQLRGAVYQVSSQFYDARGASGIQLRADPYTLVDIGFTQTILRRFAVAFDVTNLFDELYDQSYALPREGRAAVVTVRFNAK
jgi:outer membrane receptor protein involved in Fe transport